MEGKGDSSLSKFKTNKQTNDLYILLYNVYALRIAGNINGDYLFCLFHALCGVVSDTWDQNMYPPSTHIQKGKGASLSVPSTISQTLKLNENV